MKKLLFGLFSLVLIFSSLEGIAQDEAPKSQIVYSDEIGQLITDNLHSINDEVFSQVKEFFKTENINLVDFNTKEIYQQILDLKDKTVYTINYSNDELGDDVKIGYCIMVSKDNKVLSSSFVKTTRSTFEHFFIEENSGFKLTKNEKGGVELSGTYEKIPQAEAKKSLGQQMIDCINDAYSNHGWYSFGLFVGSLIEPGVGGVVAYHCYCQTFGM